RTGMNPRQVVDRQTRDRITGPEDTVTIRVIAPELLGVQVKDQVVRGVLDRRDLLEHDLALELQILRPQQRIEYEISQDIQRQPEIVAPDLGLEAGVLPGGIRVEGAAYPLQRER